MSYGIFCFSVSWKKLRDLVWVKYAMDSPVNITIKICCLEAMPMDHEDDSQSVNNDWAQESETKPFILPLTGA